MADQPPPVPLPASAEASTGDAGERRSEGRPRTFPCQQCGADLEFHIGMQSLECPYCGFVRSLEEREDAAIAEQDLLAMLERVARRRGEDRGGQAELREVRCDSCGGTVQFVGTLTSSECAYCGVPLQIENAHQAPDRIPVDGVLPFMISREQARANLAEWVRTRWFAPNDFKRRGVQGRFNGVYLPYWTFDALTRNAYTGERGEHYWVTVGSGKKRRRVRRTRWYPASGDFERFFDDVLVVAGRGLPLSRLVGLEPWPLNKCIPFNPEVLAGLLARTYDVPLDEGFVEGKVRMTAAIEDEVRGRIGGDEQRIHSIDTRYSALAYKHLLLPVWMLAYRYGDKTYQVVVNAGTGEVQGDRPYSWVKIALATAAGLIVAGLLAYMMSQS